MLGVVYIEHRHAVDGGTLCVPGGGVDHVVGPDDDGGVTGVKLGVDLLHLVELLIRDVRLAEEDIHMAGHPSSDGVDGVEDLGPVGFQLIGELFDQVLCLGQGHAVSGDDDDLLGLPQDLGGGEFFRNNWFRLLLLWSGNSGLGFGGGRSLAQEDVPQRAVHRPAHNLGQQQAGCSHHAADSDQERVADGHTGDGTSYAAQGVEQGDGDGHVSTADADGKCDAKEAADGEGHHNQQERGEALYCRSSDTDSGSNQRDGRDRLVGGPYNGFLREDLVKLARGDHAPGEGNGADHHSQRRSDSGE